MFPQFPDFYDFGFIAFLAFEVTPYTSDKSRLNRIKSSGDWKTYIQRVTTTKLIK